MNILEGYVRNYRGLNLHLSNNLSAFTAKEINYFSKVGEFLGYFSFYEDKKPDNEILRSRPMDLAWWKWDERENPEYFIGLVLHLERENQINKDFETIEKLFSKTENGFLPANVIGLINVENKERIEELKKEIVKRNKKQNSEVLILFQLYNKDEKYHEIYSYYLSENCQEFEEREIISYLDDSNYWTMSFKEEFKK